MHINDIQALNIADTNGNEITLTTAPRLDTIMIGVPMSDGRVVYSTITKDQGIVLMEWLSEVTM